MGPKDKFRCVSSHRQSIRLLLLSHYFPYLHRLLRAESEDLKSPRNVLSFEYQLQNLTLEHPALLS